MNFTPELLTFQGMLMSADNKTPFMKISSRGGNEDKILSIINVLQKFFHDNRYYTAEGMPEKRDSEIRNFCFYLILNTDFAELKEIVEYPDAGHLVWTTPTITKCLLCEIVFALHMETFLGEIVSYSNPKLSVEILKAFLNGIRYVTAQSSIDKLHELAIASYRCICRLNLFSYDDSTTINLLSELFNNFLRSITHFVSPPNNGKLEELTDEDQYVHLGKSLHSLLDVTLTCIVVYESPLQIIPDGLDDLYSTTFDLKAIKTGVPSKNVKDISEPVILEYLQKCNVALLDKCVELVMKVSVDVFCCWSEHTDDGKTLQRIVGELSYRLLQQLGQIKDLSQHTLVNMLPPIACKPVDVFDIIAEADDDAIIANTHSNVEEREHWLNAIVCRSNLYESESLMTCLIKHLAFLTPEACDKLFKRTISYLKGNKYRNENAKFLAAKCFTGVNSEKKCDLVIDLFPNRELHNLLETKEFESKMNETFNKLISSTDSDLYQVFDIFMQNPSAVYNKMLRVGIENSKQASLVLDICIMLSPFSEYCCNDEITLVKAINDLFKETLVTEVQQSSFVSLISGMSREISVVQNCLLLRIIMPCVHDAVMRKELSRLRVQLMVLEGAYEPSELARWRAPLLVTLGQIMEVVRWNFTTYSTDAPAALHQAISLQTRLISTYDSQIPDKDTNWLKSKLKALKPLNLFYFKVIWNPPGENFIQVITNSEDINVDEYPILLAKILNCCSHKEWSMIWDSLIEGRNRNSALELLHQALTLMTLAEAQHRSANSQLCLLYCYRNYISIVKEKFISDAMVEDDVNNILEKFIELANLSSDEDIDEIGAILLPLLACLTGKAQHSEGYVEIANRLKHGKFAKRVGDMFANAANLSVCPALS